MYMSESTKPEHSRNFLLASLLSELTFLWRGDIAHEKARGGRYGLTTYKMKSSSKSLCKNK